MNIFYSEVGEQDIDNLFYVITDDYKSPLTAAKYVQGIYDEINKLTTQANIHKIEKHPFIANLDLLSVVSIIKKWR